MESIKDTGNTAVAIINIALSMGLLNYPFQYKEGGLIPAIICQVVLAIFSASTLTGLGYFTIKSDGKTLEGVIAHFCGNKLKNIIKFVQIIIIFGAGIVYMIAIADFAHAITKFAIATSTNDSVNPSNAISIDDWYLDKRFLLFLIVMCISYPITFMKDDKILKYPSYVGVVSIFYITFYVIAGYFRFSSANDWVLVPENPADSLKPIPTILFGYGAVIGIVQVHDEMKYKNNFLSYGIACFSAIFACFVLCILLGTFGYLTFGANCNPNILMNYKPEIPSIIAFCALSFKLIVTLPILSWLHRKSIFEFIEDFLSPEKMKNLKDSKIFYLIPLTWYVLALTLAILTPNISYGITYIGGLESIFCYSTVGFLILFLLFRHKQFTKSIKCILLTILGGFMIVFGFTTSCLATAIVIKNSMQNNSVV